MGMNTTCTTTSQHCESCGSADREDLTTGDQGYTACCNELIVTRGGCRGHHLED